MTVTTSMDPRVLEACFATLRIGVAVFDAEQGLVYHNPRFAGLIKLPEEFLRPGVKYIDIIRANREAVPRPGRIYPGQVLDLPLVYDD